MRLHPQALAAQRDVSTTHTRRPLGLALVALAGLLAALALAGPAAAASSCGRQVIDDWYDDGRVDGTYDLHCYDDAIEALPRDVRDYSSAKDDITRAMQNRMRGEPSPPATTDPTPADDPDTPTSNEDDPAVTSETLPEDEPAETTEAIGPVDDGESASSIPLPLLLLAGIALLLVAGGSAGYLYRRLRARNVPPPAV
jgi:hypothetical protein